MSQHRDFLFEAIHRGGDHITVAVRVGEQNYGRAMAGAITLHAWEWTVLQEIVKRGAKAAEGWGEPSVEIKTSYDTRCADDIGV